MLSSLYTLNMQNVTNMVMQSTIDAILNYFLSVQNSTSMIHQRELWSQTVLFSHAAEVASVSCGLLTSCSPVRDWVQLHAVDKVSVQELHPPTLAFLHTSHRAAHLAGVNKNNCLQSQIHNLVLVQFLNYVLYSSNFHSADQEITL